MVGEGVHKRLDYLGVLPSKMLYRILFDSSLPTHYSGERRVSIRPRAHHMLTVGLIVLTKCRFLALFTNILSSLLYYPRLNQLMSFSATQSLIQFFYTSISNAQVLGHKILIQFVNDQNHLNRFYGGPFKYLRAIYIYWTSH